MLINISHGSPKILSKKVLNLLNWHIYWTLYSIKKQNCIFIISLYATLCTNLFFFAYVFDCCLVTSFLTSCNLIRAFRFDCTLLLVAVLLLLRFFLRVIWSARFGLVALCFYHTHFLNSVASCFFFRFACAISLLPRIFSFYIFFYFILSISNVFFSYFVLDETSLSFIEHSPFLFTKFSISIQLIICLTRVFARVFICVLISSFNGCPDHSKISVMFFKATFVWFSMSLKYSRIAASTLSIFETRL